MQSKHKYNFAVVIGRFQPFHNAHLKLVQDALTLADYVIVVVGSHNSAPSIRNPWSSGTRIGMIKSSLNNDRVHCVAVRDYLYNDNIWLRELQNQVDLAMLLEVPQQQSKKVILVGHHKDETSYYLDLFPQWKAMEEPTISDLSGTDFRRRFFNNGYEWAGDVPGAVVDYLRSYKQTNAYQDMVKEFAYVEDYKAKWAKSPFKPTFNTTDAVVVCAGHVLVVKRKVQPGKGLYALPGGFLGQRESVVDGMLRELCEETEINLKVGRTEYLRGRIIDQKVFDHPDRSARGRTITHAFCVHLKDWEGPLPVVKGADDAAEAQWMSLMEVGMNEPSFFEDHLHIITHFTSKF